MTIPLLSLRSLALVTAGTWLWSTTALAANAGSWAEAQARYRQDMAVCNSGKSNQSLATCRLEARNALAEARRGGLKDAPDEYQQNALQRCNALTGDDRTACEARMRGEGRVEGSVEGGGILRESVTTVPVVPDKQVDPNK
jgi:cobalamin biosynthesis Mg chelatase CobN